MSGNAVVVCVGKKGAGKTTKLRRLVKRCRRLLVLDPEAAWPLDGAREVWGARELVALLPDCASRRRRFALVYRDRDAELMQLAGPGAAYALRDLTVVIDEIALLCTARSMPERLRWLLQLGRHHRINVVGTTREPQEIHDLWFSQADLVYMFRTDPGNGLDRLRRRYGALAEDLPNLKNWKFRYYGALDAAKLFGREGLDRAGRPP